VAVHCVVLINQMQPHPVQATVLAVQAAASPILQYNLMLARAHLKPHTVCSKLILTSEGRLILTVQQQADSKQQQSQPQMPGDTAARSATYGPLAFAAKAVRLVCMHFHDLVPASVTGLLVR